MNNTQKRKIELLIEERTATRVTAIHEEYSKKETEETAETMKDLTPSWMKTFNKKFKALIKENRENIKLLASNENPFGKAGFKAHFDHILNEYQIKNFVDEKSEAIYLRPYGFKSKYDEEKANKLKAIEVAKNDILLKIWFESDADKVVAMVKEYETAIAKL